MKPTIHMGDQNTRSPIGKIIGGGMYVKLSAKEVPTDFIIYAVDLNGTKHAILPVKDYRHAKAVVANITKT